MKLSYAFMLLTSSIIACGSNQVWSSAPTALEAKEAPKVEVKAMPHPLSGKTVTMTDLGAIQTVYMGPTDGIWARTAGASGVLSFGKKGAVYPHITFGKDCINGVVAVHYSLSSSARVQFSYNLITGAGPTHLRDEGTIPPGQGAVALEKVTLFMPKFKAKVDTLLAR